MEHHLSRLALICIQAILMLWSQPLAGSSPKPHRVTEARQSSNIDYLRAKAQQALDDHHLEEAASLLERAVKRASSSKDKIKVASIMVELGRVYIDLYQIQNAHKAFLSALTTAQKAGGSAVRADAMDGMGLVAEIQGDEEKALAHYRAALKLWRQVRDRRGEGGALNDAGTLMCRLGQTKEGLHDLAVADRIADETKSLSLKITVAHNLGVAYTLTGEYRVAVDHLDRAINLATKQHDEGSRAKAQVELAKVYEHMQNAERALALLDEALHVFEKVHAIADMANALHSIGAIHAQANRFDKAENFVNRSLKIYRKLGYKSGESDALNSLAYIFGNTKREENAQKLYEQLLLIYQHEGNIPSLAAVDASLGSLCFDAGDRQGCLLHYKEAIRLYGEIGDRAGEATIHDHLGYAYASFKDFNSSRAELEAELSLKEQIASQIASERMLSKFLHGEMQDLYRQLAFMCLLRDRPDEALMFLERGRTQSLARFTAQTERRLRTVLGSETHQWITVTNNLRRIEGELGVALDQMKDAQALGDHIAEHAWIRRASLLRDKARTAEADRNRLLMILQTTHPDFVQVYQPNQLDFKALAQRLANERIGDEKTLFMEYVILDKNKTLLLVFSRKHGVAWFLLPIGEEVLHEAAKSWRSAIISKGVNELARAQDLYRKLFLTFENNFKNLSEYNSLVIIADGVLTDLPFAAMADERGTRLVERFSVSHAFSLLMLTWPFGPPADLKNIFAVANPSASIPALQLAEAQARSLVSKVKHSELVTGSAATKAAVLTHASEYRVIHFGVHAKADEQVGENSYIELAGGTKRNLRLTASEIMNQSFASQLVVLSACETAEGQQDSAEGLVGLSWAFCASGCRSVVGSLWKVEEIPTSQLMERFYTELCISGTRKDVALRMAMLAVKQTDGWSEPYYWAAFELIGGREPLELAK